MTLMTSGRLIRAADTLVNDHFAIRPGEDVLLTADTTTEHALLDCIAGSVLRAKARPVVVVAPQLPFQGGLSDPFVSDTLKAAAIASDVWFDLCFPYHAGSGAHSAAMDAKRCRYLLLSLSRAASFERIYGCVDFHALMEFNVAFAEFIAESAGQTARFTCSLGTDVSFKLDKLKMIRQRVAAEPGMQAVPGTQSFYPIMESVKGRIAIQALFDEHYRILRKPIAIEVNGKIQSFTGGGTEDRLSFERALRRASGTGEYGGFVHFTFGFHPGTQVTGEQFIEDIRIPGSNAIGMGLPWWEPGGGENHPDGLVFDQSLWIGDVQVADNGAFVGPDRLLKLFHAMTRRLD